MIPGQAVALHGTFIVLVPMHLSPWLSITPFDLVFVLVPSPHEVEHCPIVHDVHSQSMCTTIFREVNDLYYPDCGINFNGIHNI